MTETRRKGKGEKEIMSNINIIRHLIREEQKVEAQKQLESKLLEALDSGKFDEVTPEFFEGLREICREQDL